MNFKIFKNKSYIKRMLCPVCPSCQMLFADKQLIFENRREKINKISNNDEKNKQMKNLLHELGIIRYCCKTRFISYVNHVDILI